MWKAGGARQNTYAYNKCMTSQVYYSKTQDIDKSNALPIVGQCKLIGKNVMVHVAIS